jgi:hypothetical protein
MSFYGQYEAAAVEGQSPEENAPEDEEAPAQAEEIEDVLDAEASHAPAGEFDETDTPAAFDNIETGVLEHDIATHEPATVDDTDEGEVVDLGRVEGLSAAPSSLRNTTESGEIPETDKSDTIENTD